jgi:hypothetical protein
MSSSTRKPRNGDDHCPSHPCGESGVGTASKLAIELGVAAGVLVPRGD